MAKGRTNVHHVHPADNMLLFKGCLGVHGGAHHPHAAQQCAPSQSVYCSFSCFSSNSRLASRISM